MPGQGRALDGAEGARVFHQFKEYAKPFMTLMPLTRDTKAQLRAHYLQLYADAGGVLVLVVQFLCACNLFCEQACPGIQIKQKMPSIICQKGPSNP